MEMTEFAVRKIKNKTNVMVPKGNSSTFNVHRSQVLLRYTGAKKYWHPYLINTIEMRSLRMEIKYVKITVRLLKRT